MKLIKPSFMIIEQQAGIEGIYKMIELAGRVCHKSEDKITETSTKEFVERMLKMKHLSTCEFGTVYLYIDYSNCDLKEAVTNQELLPQDKCPDWEVDDFEVILDI